MSVERSCEWCAAVFEAKRHDQRCCSLSCWTRWYESKETRVCGRADCDRTLVAKGLCRTHYKATRPQANAWRRGNPETKRRGDRKRTQRRRALTRDPNADLIDRDEIGDRDGWVCGLCAQTVDRALSYPHPLSPSLDHVTPLALGGTHIATNVQISHLTCNVKKGARVA